MLEYQTKPAETGSRLDVLVSGLYPQFTRSALELLFDMGMVSVNGETGKPAYRVKAKDEIQIDETHLKSEPPAIDLPVIYQDDDVIVIDKPAGILTHSKGALNLEASIASFIKDKITDKSLTGNRAGIVHRLDRGTSGIIITARNSAALHWLQKQFSLRKVKKTYMAVVEGLMEPPEALIDAPIGRNPKRPQTFKVLASGKPAQTTYKVVKQFEKDGANYSQVELSPQTGRTHQLRVHLAYIGHPIVGDYVYGHGGQPMLLQATQLEVTLPSRERKIFESPQTRYFKEFTGDV
jgi:23S rRNA pseudouridine1911/1915/1917 synthase